MTPYEQAYILRLCACEITNERQGAQNLRRALRDLGWEDAAVERAVSEARRVLATVRVGQAELFERAA